MEVYHKINAPFKRYLDGPKKGKLIVGDWARPEFEYLADNRWEFTEKVDGTNIRVGWGYDAGKREKSVKFAGRSANAVIPTSLMAWLEDTFDTNVFEKAFPDAAPNEVVLYGEGYGAKIQGGGKYRDDTSFVLFDVKIGDWWLDRANVNDIANKLGVESVPVLGTGTLADAMEIVSSGITFGPMGELIRWGNGGLQSRWGNFEAEGIVARPVVPLFNRKGERIITKIKGKDFK